MPDAIAEGRQAASEYRQTEAAFTAVREAMTDTLLASSPGETVLREKLYLGIQSLDAVEKALMSVIDSGKIEEAQREIEAQLRPNPVSAPFAR